MFRERMIPATLAKLDMTEAGIAVLDLVCAVSKSLLAELQVEFGVRLKYNDAPSGDGVIAIVGCDMRHPGKVRETQCIELWATPESLAPVAKIGGVEVKMRRLIGAPHGRIGLTLRLVAPVSAEVLTALAVLVKGSCCLCIAVEQEQLPLGLDGLRQAVERFKQAVGESGCEVSVEVSTRNGPVKVDLRNGKRRRGKVGRAAETSP